MLPNKKEKPSRSNRSSDDTQLSIYLRAIARHPVPSKEEAIELARQVQAAIALERIRDELKNERDRNPTLEEWSINTNLLQLELQNTLRQGQRAKQRLLEGNLRLVLNIAKKYLSHGMEMLDLMQEGSLGLLHGIEKFDPSKGYAFSTYVYWWIRQAITRSITDKSRTIRLPSHRVEQLSKLSRAASKFSVSHGRNPSISELVTLTGLSQAEIENTNSVGKQPLSLDQAINDEDGDTLDYYLGGLDSSVDDEDRLDCLRENLKVLMTRSNLTPREEFIISNSYGLNGLERLEFKQIAPLFEIKTTRVSQVRLIAIRKMQNQRMHYPAIASLLAE